MTSGNRLLLHHATSRIGHTLTKKHHQTSSNIIHRRIISRENYQHSRYTLPSSSISSNITSLSSSLSSSAVSSSTITAIPSSYLLTQQLPLSPFRYVGVHSSTKSVTKAMATTVSLMTLFFLYYEDALPILKTRSSTNEIDDDNHHFETMIPAIRTIFQSYRDAINRIIKYNTPPSPTTPTITSPSSSPSFPTISTTITTPSSGTTHPLPPNTTHPIPFQTELFSGHTLLLLRPTHPDDDPHYHPLFFASHPTKQLEIQIQGRFNTKPRGVVYMGLEVTDFIGSAGNSGPVIRGLCRLILKLLEAGGIRDMYYSLGDGGELARIVAPIQYNMDNCIVTSMTHDSHSPSSSSSSFQSEPPALGHPINPHAYEFHNNNTNNSRQMRHDRDPSWNTHDTYTFSFYTSFVDLKKWRIVNLPFGMGELSLDTFFPKGSRLRLVAYEKEVFEREEEDDDDDGRHENVRYLFCTEIEPRLLSCCDTKENEIENKKIEMGGSGDIICDDAMSMTTAFDESLYHRRDVVVDNDDDGGASNRRWESEFMTYLGHDTLFGI